MTSDRLRNVLVCKCWFCEFHLQLDVWGQRDSCILVLQGIPPLRRFRCCFYSYCARELVNLRKQGEWKNVVGKTAFLMIRFDRYGPCWQFLFPRVHSESCFKCVRTHTQVEIMNRWISPANGVSTPRVTSTHIRHIKEDTLACPSEIAL